MTKTLPPYSPLLGYFGLFSHNPRGIGVRVGDFGPFPHDSQEIAARYTAQMLGLSCTGERAREVVLHYGDFGVWER